MGLLCVQLQVARATLRVGRDSASVAFEVLALMKTPRRHLTLPHPLYKTTNASSLGKGFPR